MEDIKLIHGDSLQALKGYGDNYFDVAIVDPPYGIGLMKTEKGNWGIRKNNKGSIDKKTQWDFETPEQEYFDELFRVSKHQIIWGGNYFIDKIKKPSQGWIVWNKVQRDFTMSDAELAYSSFDKTIRCFDMIRWKSREDNYKNGGKIHQAQKPVALYNWILENYTEQGDLILDTHLGSGSIAIACHRMKRKLIGYEIDKEYYDAACKRFKEQTMQQALW